MGNNVSEKIKNNNNNIKQNEVIQNTYLDDKISNMKNIHLCLNIIYNRKKLQHLNYKISNEAKYEFEKSEKKNESPLKENEFFKNFENILTIFKSIVGESTNHIKLIGCPDSLSIIQEETKDHYIKHIEKYYSDILQILIRIKEDNIEHILSDDSNKLNYQKMNYDIKNLSKEFDLIFNYNDNDYSIFHKYDGYPPDIKRFLNKFLYLKILKKSDYLENTGNYIKIENKDTIKNFKSRKCIQILEREEIIDENYNQLFEMLDQDNQIENFYVPTVNDIKDDKLTSYSNKVREISLKRKKLANVFLDVKNINSLFKSSVLSIEQNDKCDKKVRKKDLKLDHREFIKRYVNLDISRKSISNNFEYYKGEYDNMNYHFNGTGTLIKLKNNTLCYYYGNFKEGKKHGIGNFYKINSENEIEFYRGEWSRNKMDGFGLLIKNNNNNLKKLQKGKFTQGIIIYGIQILILENNNEIKIDKYEGDIFNDNYHGLGKLKRNIRKVNKELEKKYSNSEIDTEYDYEYNGAFLNNLENGKGTSRKKYSNSGYTFTGEFLNGKMHGMGLIEYDGDNHNISSYNGIFENDQPFAIYGIVTFKCGDKFEGFFNHNYKKTNLGLYFYSNEDLDKEHFFGKFENDKKNGLGRFVNLKETKIFVGSYMDGEKNGRFSLVIGNLKSNRTETFENKHSLLQSQFNFKSKNSVSSINNFLNTFPIKNQIRFPKQIKMFYLFENDEIIEKSEKPII